MSDGRETILCISSYEKGKAFLSEAARLGCNVLLLTVEKLKDASWPREALADLMTMPEGLTPEQVLNTVTYRARHQRIDRIVALDEFDLEAAALITSNETGDPAPIASLPLRFQALWHARASACRWVARLLSMPSLVDASASLAAADGRLPRAIMGLIKAPGLAV